MSLIKIAEKIDALIARRAAIDAEIAILKTDVIALLDAPHAAPPSATARSKKLRAAWQRRKAEHGPSGRPTKTYGKAAAAEMAAAVDMIPRDQKEPRAAAASGV